MKKEISYIAFDGKGLILNQNVVSTKKRKILSKKYIKQLILLKTIVQIKNVLVVHFSTLTKTVANL